MASFFTAKCPGCGKIKDLDMDDATIPEHKMLNSPSESCLGSGASFARQASAVLNLARVVR